MLADAVVAEIKRDVSAFADPGTSVELSQLGKLEWTRSRRRCSAQLLADADVYPTVEVEGRTLSYKSFLSSEFLSDLRDLAQSIVQQTPETAMYLPVPARDDAGHAPDAALRILSSATEGRPWNATRVVFVHGNAGTGKTSVLAHLARSQAERFLSGAASTLLLYLDAQGRSLVQLEDVMARALQDLRARFTYHGVAALTRRQCVIPIVDGFDELIGPSSAREAFANLSKFLVQLDRMGSIITSSRSAFIDYKTLYERAANQAGSQVMSYEIQQLEILPWPDETVIDYCARRSPNDSQLQMKVRDLLGTRQGDLARKPFFLSHIADILLAGQDVSVDVDIVEQVVEAGLEREAGKLLDSRGGRLLTPMQHRNFCEALAEEMWAQGAPELDCETIRVVAELYAEEIELPARESKILVDRSITHGLLSPVQGATIDKRAFEHELFRFDFQAGRLSRALTDSSDLLLDYLRRGELAPELVDRLTIVKEWRIADLPSVLERLNELVSRSTRNPYAASNAGTIAAVLLRDRALPAALSLRGLYVRYQGVGRVVLNGAIIRDCVFESVDLSQAQFVACTIEGCQFLSCKITESTRWTETRLSVADFPGVNTLKEGVSEETFNPERIASWLRSGGAIVLGDRTALAGAGRAAERERLTLGLLQRARNHYYLSRNDPWARGHLLDSPEWPAVEKLLKDSGLMEEVKVQKSGPSETFMRLTAPPDVILRARIRLEPGTRATSFWQQLLST